MSNHKDNLVVTQESRKDHKRNSDPFVELPDSYADHFLSNAGEQQIGQHDTSFYDRFIVGPVTMVSFLLSLCIVNREEQAWRVAQHDGGGDLSRLTRWFGSEPYQDSAHITSAGTSNAIDLQDNVSVPHVDTERWYTQKKHRKMASYRLREAFGLQHKIAVLLVSCITVAMLGMFWALRKSLGYWQG